ncbi:MAG: glycosyltransferase family 2 protein [Proteobacteria bacterium]|nr:glycosyltransferase family 2 protein [Pseudomonadota bacterium]
MKTNGEYWQAYKLRWKRRKLLYRAIRKRHQLKSVINRTKDIRPDTILCAATVRNEIVRLPYFLAHHRKVGVGHFLFIDNDSDDATLEYLRKQPDVSLWATPNSYKESRFGIDWITWLQMKYAHGHWCLTLDADEIFVYPNWAKCNLSELTGWLDTQGASAMSALMLDMYPKGPLSSVKYEQNADPFKTLKWFDSDNYTWERQQKFRNISIRGGARKRKFFTAQPELAPHMHKTPLIKWHRSYVYASSTHIALPSRLNNGFDARNGLPTGTLLHSKFMNVVLAKSTEEKIRREHFTHTDKYSDYYDQIIADPDFWHKGSVCYKDWQQLERLGLMTSGSWTRP